MKRRVGRTALPRAARGQSVSAADARRLIFELPGVEEGRSYGLPAFLVAGQFLARFRDADEVLVVKLGAIEDRDVLMQLDPDAFSFTEHYRDWPAVLVRLAKVRPGLLASVLRDARRSMASTEQRPQRRAATARRRTGRR